jgi:secondary thiamine-phosphate synthase enzyme
MRWRDMTEAPIRQHSDTLVVETGGQGLLEVTRQIERWIDTTDIVEGVLTLFCRHTSASLLIQENAAPAVQRDISAYFARIAPEDPSRYEHDDEGPDDMPAHLRTALTSVSLQIPVIAGRPRLGTWQGIYLFEHRRRPHRRELAIHIIGSG